MPWERTFEQVKQDVSDALQVITSGLLFTLMSCNGGVSGSPSQIFAVLVRNMITLTIHVTLGETKINNVDSIACRLSCSDKEVIGLDIAMNNSLGVDLLEMVH